MPEHDHSLSTSRIEAFSDAVFAIVVTLLVLDLKIPEMVGSISPAETLMKLSAIIPQFLSFAMSFLIICIFWVNHHQFFSILKNADRKFVWLNNFLLFWLCFIPFPTAFLGRYPNNLVAVMFFGTVLFLAASSYALMMSYAFFKANLVDVHVSMSERNGAFKRSLVGIILYALSVIVAPVSILVSLVIFCIVPIYYFVPRRFAFN